MFCNEWFFFTNFLPKNSHKCQHSKECVQMSSFSLFIALQNKKARTLGSAYTTGVNNNCSTKAQFDVRNFNFRAHAAILNLYIVVLINSIN